MRTKYFITVLCLFVVLLGNPILSDSALSTAKSGDFFIKLLYNENDIVSGESHYLLRNPYEYPLPLKDNLNFYIETKTQDNEVYFMKTGILRNITINHTTKSTACETITVVDSYLKNGSVDKTHTEEVNCHQVENTVKEVREILDDLPEYLQPKQEIIISIQAKWTALKGFALEWIPRFKVYNEAKTESVTLDNVKWSWWNASYSYSRGLKWTTTNAGTGTVIVKVNATGSSDSGFDLGDCAVNQSVWIPCDFDANGVCYAWLYYNDCSDYVIVDNTNTTRLAMNVVKGDIANYSTRSGGTFGNSSLLIWETFEDLTTLDQSVNENDINNTAGLLETANCVHGNCLNTDGRVPSGTSSGNTVFNYSTSLAVNEGFTICMWEYHHDLNNGDRLVVSGKADQNNDNGYFIYLPANYQVNFQIKTGSYWNLGGDSATLTKVINVWEYWCYSYTDGNNLMSIYRNGTLVRQGNPDTMVQVTEKGLILSSPIDHSAYGCNMSIDDLRYYNYALTDSEINISYSFVGTIGKQESYIPPIEISYITFIEPTPVNNDEVGFNYDFVINVSYNTTMTPKNITFEVNNVNVSSTNITNSSGTMAYIPTITEGTTYDYKAFIITDEGLNNVTETRSLNVSRFTESELEMFDSMLTVNDVITILLVLVVVILIYTLMRL